MANISGRSPYIFYMLCVILLLVLTAAMATRPLKTDLLHRGSAQTGTEDSLQGSFQQGALKADLLEESTEESSCEGLEEEECLNRRSLAAHTDYIYTQHHKHP